jgi:hypothetical protein
MNEGDAAGTAAGVEAGPFLKANREMLLTDFKG